jgi:hypothetical protein
MVSRFNLSKLFNKLHALSILQKALQIGDHYCLNMDPGGAAAVFVRFGPSVGKTKPWFWRKKARNVS